MKTTKGRTASPALVLTAALALAGAATARAQGADAGYPKKAITLICPFAAGGSTDLLGRALAQSATKLLGQPVVVENRPGASGTIGTDYVLKSAPDGYTLLTSSTGNFTSTPLVQKVPYDPNKDVKHIINVASHAIVLVVNSESPWKSLDEFVAHVKKNPNKVKYGQNAPGGTTHMAMEAFRKAAGLPMKMIPYGGGGAEVNAALLGRHVDCAVMHPQEGKEFIASGKLRVLTVFSAKRLKSLPDVPTAKEKGYDVVMSVTKGIAGPATLPDPIVAKLHDAFKKAMSEESFLAAAKNTGDLEYLDYMSGPDTARYLQAMSVTMAPMIKELGLSKK